MSSLTIEEIDEFQGIVDSVGLEYHVTYPEGHEHELVKLEFSDFAPPTRDGLEKAELRVTYRGREVHMRSRVSINSTTGQQSVKSAADRCIKSAPNVMWGDLLEKAFSAVRKEQKKGNPVENLKHGSISESTQYILEPFLVSSQSNLLYGNGGLG